PAGSTTTPVKNCMPFPTYPVLGGEIGSPVWYPGGHVSVRAPQSSVTVLPRPFATHTWSLPSIVMPQGPIMLSPPLNGEPGDWVPSGRIMLTLPFGYASKMWTKATKSSTALSPLPSGVSLLFTLFQSKCSISIQLGSPIVLATHALPWLSIAIAWGL